MASDSSVNRSTIDGDMNALNVVGVAKQVERQWQRDRVERLWQRDKGAER